MNADDLMRIMSEAARATVESTEMYPHADIQGWAAHFAVFDRASTQMLNIDDDPTRHKYALFQIIAACVRWIADIERGQFGS